VDKPNASQSAIFLGNLVIPRKAPEYADLKLATDILGGRSTARLYMNLRQDKGYTYGAYSFLSSHCGQSAFISYAQVQTDFTKESLVEFMREIKGITGERPIPADELKAGQNYLAKGFPQAFQTFNGVAEQMSTLITYDLPLDEWQAYMDHISSAGISTVTNTAKRFIHPEAQIIVVVGDLQKIEAGIRELNLGTVEIISSESI
jgi:zinc protease